MGEVGEIRIPVSQEEWEKSSGKPKVGSHPVEVINCGWETEGKSIKFEVQITKGTEEGKQDKIVGGALPGKTFKTKEILDNLGVPYKFVKGALSFNFEDVIGKEGVGIWSEETGHKGGDPSGPVVKYPKLQTILKKGAKIE